MMCNPNRKGSIKDVRTQGGLSSATFCVLGDGVFRCGRPHFLALKSSNFLKFMVCLHGQERGSELFADK